MTDLTTIFSAVITLIATLITTFLIPFIKSKMSNEKFESIKSWVKVAVQAAEMIYTETGMGAKKKAYVVDYLNKKGYKIDLDAIDVLIEAAVLEIQNS